MLEAVFVSECETPTLNVTTCCVSKPGLTFHKLTDRRNNRPAPTSNTRVKSHLDDHETALRAMMGARRAAAPFLQGGLADQRSNSSARAQGQTESQQQSKRHKVKSRTEYSHRCFRCAAGFPALPPAPI